MKKHKMTWHGHDYYLLGTDHNGTKYYLEQASWDCGWYWGGGYVETFTNNRSPEQSKDIRSHEHFNGLYLKDGYKTFWLKLIDSPLTDSEKWKLLELMKSFYISREYSDMLYIGGAHYTENPVSEAIKNKTEYDRINNEVIPTIFSAVYKLLSE